MRFPELSITIYYSLSLTIFSNYGSSGNCGFIDIYFADTTVDNFALATVLILSFIDPALS